MGGGRWEVADGMWEVADGRWEMGCGSGRRDVGGGRWDVGGGRWDVVSCRWVPYQNGYWIIVLSGNKSGLRHYIRKCTFKHLQCRERECGREWA